MVTLEFDKKVKCGPEYVAVRILANCEELKIGNIWLPELVGENMRLALCRIEDVGEKAASEYGLAPGDYVMIDRLSTFAHTAPVALTKYNNVICLTDEKQSLYRPVRNMVFIEPDQKDAVSDVGGIAVANYGDRLNTGVVTEMNVDIEGYPFKVGDRVMLTKGADCVDFGNRRVYIYKPDMLVCRIED